MDTSFEATFAIDIAREEAWETLRRHKAPPAESAWGNAEKPAPAGTRWLAGFDAFVDVLAEEPGYTFRCRKATEPCAGTEILIQLEDDGSGTRVTVVQSGFPSWVKGALDSFGIGWEQILADFALYMERGIVGGRHTAPWAGFGTRTRSTPMGLEVTFVFDDSYASKAGICKGDLLVSVGGAPVVTISDLCTVMRIYREGDEVEAKFVRGRELIVSSLPL